MVVNLWQENDPSEFIQRHYQPHNNREKCCWKTFLQYTIPWTGKLVSGGNKGHEMLSLPNTTFSSRENHGDNHLYCPMGKAFSTSKPCKPVCLVRKKNQKTDFAKLWSESLNGLGKSGGTQVWALLSVCRTFYLHSRWEGRDHRGRLLTGHSEAGTCRHSMTHSWLLPKTPRFTLP